MFIRIILACSAILLLTRPGAAEDCRALGFEGREAVVRQAPTCDKAMERFGDCNYGAGGDIGLGQIVTEKCETVFLKKLNAQARRSYRRGIKTCNDADKEDEGTLSHAIAAGCRANLAQDYARKFGKAR